MADQKRKARSDGRFEAKITEGGKRISRYFSTSAEANAWRTQQKALQLEGIKLIPEKVPFGVLAEAWLLAKRGSVRLTTFENYQLMYDLHIKDKFAASTPQEVCGELQEYINAKKLTHSASIVRCLHFLIQSVLRLAVDKSLIRKQPRIIGLPMPNKREPEPMTKDQMVLLLRAAKKSRYSPALWLELGTGLRRGEILALEWSDLGPDYVKVTKTLERSNGGSVIQAPKTKAGKRKVYVDPLILAKVRCMPKIKIKSDDTSDDTLSSKILFCTQSGGYILPRNFSRQFKSWVSVADKLIRAENIKRKEENVEEVPLMAGRRLHDMRHQFGSLMADLGIHPSVAKGLTGHSREDMVLAYTNPTAALGKAASQRIGARLAELLDS